MLQKLIADEKSTSVEEISLNDIIEYLKNVNGHVFGDETFAPVYESGKSIKEIDLVWAPVIESIYTNCIRYQKAFPLNNALQIIFSDETYADALLTRPIEKYLEEKSDIDVLFGYTSAVNTFIFY